MVIDTESDSSPGIRVLIYTSRWTTNHIATKILSYAERLTRRCSGIACLANALSPVYVEMVVYVCKAKVKQYEQSIDDHMNTRQKEAKDVHHRANSQCIESP